MWLFPPLHILNFNPFPGDNLSNYDDGKGSLDQESKDLVFRSDASADQQGGLRKCT